MRGSLLRRARERLGAAGVESVENEASILVAHVLRTAWGGECGEVLDAMLERRERREPLQYIIGNWDFRALRDLRIRAPVLVPRPETEGLVSLVLEEIERGAGMKGGDDEGRGRREEWTGKSELDADSAGRHGLRPVSVELGPRSGLREAWRRRGRRARVLDVGTGSGAIALSVALECGAECVDVTAVDVSMEAVALARENAEHFGLQHAVRIERADAAAFRAAAPFDVVVSNPPYVPSAEWAELMPEVREWEDRRAVDGGEDGLDVARGVVGAAYSNGWLHADGSSVVLLELSESQVSSLASLGARLGLERGSPALRVTDAFSDAFGRARFVRLGR